MSYSGRPDSYSQSSADLPLSKQLQKLRKFSANQPQTESPNRAPFQPRHQMDQFLHPTQYDETPKRLNKYTLQNQESTYDPDHSSKPRSIIKKNSKYKENYKAKNHHDENLPQKYKSQSVDHNQRADYGDYGYNPRGSEGQGTELQDNDSLDKEIRQSLGRSMIKGGRTSSAQGGVEGMVDRSLERGDRFGHNDINVG
jgi:hypothetical protein